MRQPRRTWLRVAEWVGELLKGREEEDVRGRRRRVVAEEVARDEEAVEGRARRREASEKGFAVRSSMMGNALVCVVGIGEVKVAGLEFEDACLKAWRWKGCFGRGVHLIQ